MALSWFRKSKRDASAPQSSAAGTPPAVPDGRRIYAIGDLHGRLDLLEDLLGQIEAEAAAGTGSEVIFLGDYIDRGPQSAAVLDRLSRWTLPFPRRTLRGNHEQVMIDAFQDEDIFGQWRRFGGLETLASYGVPTQEVMRGQGFAEAQAALRSRVPPAHRQFLEATELSAEVGGYFFCHAGCRPGIPLARQAAQDLLWIREEFLAHTAPFEKFIVHGHTPVEEPEILAGRINIDTGAYASGNLTCLVLEGTTRRFLQARR